MMEPISWNEFATVIRRSLINRLEPFELNGEEYCYVPLELIIEMRHAITELGEQINLPANLSNQIIHTLEQSSYTMSRAEVINNVTRLINQAKTESEIH